MVPVDDGGFSFCFWVFRDVRNNRITMMTSLLEFVCKSFINSCTSFVK